MSDLVVIGFDEENKAFELQKALAGMQEERLVEMDDVTVATKDVKGKVNIHHYGTREEASAIRGGFCGLLVGAIFLQPALGAALGLGAGEVYGLLADIGISDKFIKELGETLKPCNSALFVLVRKSNRSEVLERLQGFEGKVLKTSISADRETALCAALKKVKAD